MIEIRFIALQCTSVGIYWRAGFTAQMSVTRPAQRNRQITKNITEIQKQKTKTVVVLISP
jgi:hypothetical protein